MPFFHHGRQKSCLQCRKVIRRKHQTFPCHPYIFRCETSLLARSLFSTEHSSLLLACDGVVGPKRTDGRSESERHLCRVCRARRPSARLPSPLTPTRASSVRAAQHHRGAAVKRKSRPPASPGLRPRKPSFICRFRPPLLCWKKSCFDPILWTYLSPTRRIFSFPLFPGTTRRTSLKLIRFGTASHHNDVARAHPVPIAKHFFHSA